MQHDDLLDDIPINVEIPQHRYEEKTTDFISGEGVETKEE